MTGSAAILGLLGLVALFLPVEMARAAGWEARSGLAIQVAAGGLLAVATLNWMGRTAVYGGIYGRPIVLANVALGTVAGLSLGRFALSTPSALWAWLGTLLFLAQAVAFGYVMRMGPWKETLDPQETS
jgi:hypothetical protein